MKALDFRFPFIFIVVFFLSSCGMPSAILPTATLPVQPTDQPLPTVTPACISAQPAPSDINRALTYTNELFDSSDWERSYLVAENRVAVTWNNFTQGAVAYLEALIFPCGYEEPDLDGYFSDDNWKIIFENYESYELTAECKTEDGLRLYEFDASAQGFDYLISYWVENDTATRVVVMMMTFPLDSVASLGDFSVQLFPDLPNCS